MKFLIVGCGSIAKRHTKNLLEIGSPSDHIFLFDPQKKRTEELRELFSIPQPNCFTNIDNAIKESSANAALVCCPTAFHTTAGLELAKAGIHIFMEKPIAADATDLDKLISIVADRQLVFMVGYFFRFHPGYQTVRQLIQSGAVGKILSARVECGQYLPDWHPWEDYRQFYMSKKSEGGGALLDISHEFDYLKSFIDSNVAQVACFFDTLGSLEMDADNVSSTLLRFENGVIASVHLDLLQRVVRRNCELIGEKGTILWDHPSKSVTLLTPENKNGIVKTYEFDGNQAYIDELKHFVDCIKSQRRPVVDGVSGYETLQVILAARRASDESQVIRLSS